MSNRDEYPINRDDQSLLDWIDEVADRFESAWKGARRDESPPPNLEDYATAPDEQKRQQLLLILIPLDIDYRSGRHDLIVSHPQRLAISQNIFPHPASRA